MANKIYAVRGQQRLKREHLDVVEERSAEGLLYVAAPTKEQAVQNLADFGYRFSASMLQVAGDAFLFARDLRKQSHVKVPSVYLTDCFSQLAARVSIDGSAFLIAEREDLEFCFSG